MPLIIALSVGAALLNAISVILQRRVAGNPAPGELFRIPFIKNLTLNKIWLAGLGLQAVAFLLQAAALRHGSLIVVEPLLTIDLVFMLLILHYKYNVHANPRDWGAIAMICIGLTGLLISTDVRHVRHHFSYSSWVAAVSVILFLIIAAIFIVRREESSKQRAWIMGAAAGLSFALGAAFTKLTVSRLHFGVMAEFHGWPIYALILSGILAILMTQNAYGAGPLVSSQPIMEITEPIVSIILAMLLFGDSIDLRPAAIFMEVITGLTACVGIWLLSSSDSSQLQNA